MNTKKYAAFAIAMAMAVSCLGALFASEGSEAANLTDLTMNEGDVWGMGAYLDDDTLIKVVLKSLKESDDPFAEGLSGQIKIEDKAGLIELIKKMAKNDFTFEELDFSVYVGLYVLFEVASKDSDGYVINFAASALIEADVTVKCTEVNSLSEKPGKMDIRDTIVLGAIMLGTISTDSELWVKKISVTTDVFATLKGENSVTGYGSGSEDDSMLGAFMGSVDMGFSIGYDSTTEFERGKSFKLIPEDGKKGKYRNVRATSEIYNHIFAFGKFPTDLFGKDDSAIGDELDDMDFPDIGFDFLDGDFFEDFDVALSAASFLEKNRADATISVEIDDDGEIGYDLDGIGIMTPFGDKDFGIKFDMGDDDGEDSMKGLLGSNLVYEKGFKLTGGNVGKVKDGVSKAIRAYEDGFYGKEVEVFGDFAESPLKKRYGEPIGAYEGKVPDGKKFVGWNVSSGGMQLVPEDFVLKSNVKAKPVFVKEFTMDQILANGFNVGNGMIYVKVADDETREIPSGILAAVKARGGVLIIEGPDYRWSLVGGALAAGTTLNPVVEKKEWKEKERFAEQDVVQLSFRAKGKMPDGTKVAYDVSGEFAVGSMVDVYVMSDDGKTVEFVGSYLVGASGNVEFDVPHCSEYLLVQNSMPTRASADGGEGEFPLLLVAVAACVVVAAIAVVFFIRK